MFVFDAEFVEVVESGFALNARGLGVRVGSRPGLARFSHNRRRGGAFLTDVAGDDASVLGHVAEMGCSANGFEAVFVPGERCRAAGAVAVAAGGRSTKLAREYSARAQCDRPRRRRPLPEQRGPGSGTCSSGKTPGSWYGQGHEYQSLIVHQPSYPRYGSCPRCGSYSRYGLGGFLRGDRVDLLCPPEWASGRVSDLGPSSTW
jgi:hypothetical protein